MKLSQLYDKLTVAEREALALKADMSPAYLWQIATRWRGRRPSVDLLARLAAADKRLSLKQMVSEFTAEAA